MIKYKFLFALIVIFGYLFSTYIEYKSLNKEKKVYLKDLNIPLVNINKSIAINLDNIVSSSFRDWGLKKSSLLKKRERLIEKKLKNKDKLDLKDKKFDVKNRTICLGKECWEFLGIIKVGNSTTVTLLPKRNNSKLRTFKIGDLLLDNLKIIGIKDEYLLLLNIKNNKRIYLKLFDVDILKYKPKNTNIKESKKELN